MKIAIVNDNFDIGGIQRVTSVIGTALSEYHEVYFYSMFGKENFYGIQDNFFVGDYKTYKNQWMSLANYRKQIEYTFHGKYIPAKYYKSEIFDFVSFIERNQIELVVISSPKIISFIPNIKEVSKVKCIAWLHNNFDVYMKNYTKKYNIAFVKGLEMADRAVCLTRSDLEKYSKINKRTYCFYNPLTITNTEKSNLSIKNISFTGRLSFEHKGIDYLVEIAKKIPSDWSITIAGDGSEKERKRLNQLIKENNLESKLIFKGSLKGKDLINHYKNSSIYLMTSRWEGMPLVLAEAMSFGLPIIAFEQTGSSEVLNDGEFGCLVENGNIAEMVRKIKQLINEIELRNGYSNKSLVRISDFSITKIMKEWESLLNTLK
ncbi:glycosyltransferase [Enterococcus casseliflavus]|uniref:glycosyltransferase n=1 Tax=Enterococcus casseliflavus TaxID=37734 RepID=UPI0035CAF916